MRTRVITLLLLLGAASLWASRPTEAQALPLGDGHVSTRPEVGYVDACRTTFRGGGARHDGPWIEGTTWDPGQKPHVLGDVTWPQASFTLTQQGGKLDVSSNGLPVGEPTGTFPIARSDPAYAFDTNPNAIATLDLSFQVPATPTEAAQPGCLPMGMIGFTVTGVAIYSALDDAGRDAAAHEIQDLCDGHPQGKGQYHYHSSSPCLPGAQTDALVGYALDGYPILGMRDADGTKITNADLDACHGRHETVRVDGRTYDYAYRLTETYPYTLGCFTGVVEPGTLRAVRHAMGPPEARP